MFSGVENLKKICLSLFLVFFFSACSSTPGSSKSGPTSPGGKSIGNLMFSPKTGRFEYIGRTNKDENEYSIGTINGSTYKTTTRTLENFLNYGVTDNFSVGLNLDYQSSDITVNSQSQSSLDADTNNRGLRNLGLDTNYQLLGSGFFSIDLNVQAKLKLDEIKRSSSYTNTSGNNTSSVNGNAWDSNELGAKLSIGYDNEDNPGIKLSCGYIKVLAADITILKGDPSISSDPDLLIHSDAVSALNYGIKMDWHWFSFFTFGLGYEQINIPEINGSFKFASDPTINNTIKDTSHYIQDVNVNVKVLFGSSIMLKYDADWISKSSYEEVLSGLTNDSSTINQNLDVRQVFSLYLTF